MESLIASLLKSPGLFSVFWLTSIMLSFGWCPLVLFIIIIINNILRIFRASFSWWFPTGVRVTASVLRYPGLFSVFEPILIMLSFGWSPWILLSKSFSPCTNPLVTVPSAPFTIGITVTFLFNIFFSSLAWSRYLGFFFFFSFKLWSPGTEKSTVRQVLFFFFFFFLLSFSFKLWSPGTEKSTVRQVLFFFFFFFFFFFCFRLVLNCGHPERKSPLFGRFSFFFFFFFFFFFCFRLVLNCGHPERKSPLFGRFSFFLFFFFFFLLSFSFKLWSPGTEKSTVRQVLFFSFFFFFFFFCFRLVLNCGHPERKSPLFGRFSFFLFFFFFFFFAFV